MTNILIWYILPAVVILITYVVMFRDKIDKAIKDSHEHNFHDLTKQRIENMSIAIALIPLLNIILVMTGLILFLIKKYKGLT